MSETAVDNISTVVDSVRFTGDQPDILSYGMLPMMSGKTISAGTSAIESGELFEMANLYPRTTGLPMTVWVSPRGHARQDVRLKVNVTHGNQMTVENTAVVAVRPVPYLIAGRLSADDERAVFDWVALNAAALIGYWDGDIDTVQLSQLLRPLPAR
jgi:hypothetical protein